MHRSALVALASNVVPGVGTVDLQPLGAGLVNESWCASRGGRRYVLRVGEQAPDLGLNRQWECRVLASAAAADLAPRVLACEPDEGILLTEWVEGAAPSAASPSATSAGEARAPDPLGGAMAQLLRRVHRLQVAPPVRAMGPREWIALYSATVPGDAGLAAAAGGRVELLAGCAPTDPVLCHSDLHRLNVVMGAAAPMLLDWEYAHCGDGFWDLAGWIANNDGGADFARAFAAAYLQRAPTEAEWQRLRCMVWLYDYVCVLWSGVYAARRGRDADPSVASRARLLAERLGAGTLVDR